MKRETQIVWVVAYRNSGGAGFDWFYDQSKAEAKMIEEMAENAKTRERGDEEPYILGIFPAIVSAGPRDVAMQEIIDREIEYTFDEVLNRVERGEDIDEPVECWEVEP